MGSLADFKENPHSLPPAPKGWEPQVEVTGNTGFVVLQRSSATGKEEELLADAGFDATEYRIKGDISYRKWQRYDHEWLFYVRFDIERITEETPADIKADVDQIIKSMLRTKVPARKVTPGDDALVAVFSDWQVGKNTDHTVQSVQNCIENLVLRLKELRKNGHTLDTLVLLCTGDLFEGCQGFYPSQTFLVDLDRRGQSRVVRRLLVHAVRTLAPLVGHLTVVGVGGNHGEARLNGKAFTTTADNDDVAVIEVVAEIFATRPGYEHVTFQVAEDQLSACIDIKGVPVGLTHGHLAGGGALPANKQKKWWGDQWWNERNPVPKAKILVTSHYHHFSSAVWGTRTWMQSPALDGGSPWYNQIAGLDGPDGMLTFVVDPRVPLGWDDLKIL